MLSTLVMTVIGPDRPGLVELVADRVARNGGNWLESRMCRLGGQFAGIVRVEAPVDRVNDLVNALRTLEHDGLRALVNPEPAIATADTAASAQKPAGTLAQLELVGQDRPGILLEISRILAAHRVNVEDLSSERVSAPMDGNMLFQARANLLVPPNRPLAALRTDLEKIAADLMVDIRLQPAPGR
jgi:glycine cleavage system regulatory protein